jgi:transcriptional regulator GlxA family with amidase domain
MALDICVLVMDGCATLSSIGPMDILSTASRLHAQVHGTETEPPFFRVRLVSTTAQSVVTANSYALQCHTTIDKVRKTDLVIIPAFDGDVLSQMQGNRACIPWVRRMHDTGADIASICTGAFVLAETGLLDGKRATTHWAAQDLFRQRYPRVRMAAEQIVVDNGRICTSGGATSFLTLTAYLVEKYCGPETSRVVAKIFLIDVNKGPQTAYAMFSTQKNHSDSAILEAQALIERPQAPMLSVSELATAVAMSRRNFIRRFKSATGNTPVEYIQRVRVESAKHALEAGDEPVDAIASRTGYEDAGSFRKIFKRFTGVSPIEYRRRSRFFHDAGRGAPASAGGRSEAGQRSKPGGRPARRPLSARRGRAIPAGRAAAAARSR